MSTLDSGDLWLFGAGVTLFGLIGGVIARDRSVQRDKNVREDKMHERVTRVREDLSRDLGELRRELNDYKLEVQREYASVGHLKEVETRLAQAIERLDSRLEAMPGQLAQELKQVFNTSD
ncbi:hypothetical protein IWQ55_006394 [Labrenzia sp. EL_208]|nr:hypothetical protein [Labrenzia sp. EL_132]MBG6233159.1 hypothetical protein [Labrenzia sp. EL_208]